MDSESEDEIHKYDTGDDDWDSSDVEDAVSAVAVTDVQDSGDVRGDGSDGHLNEGDGSQTTAVRGNDRSSDHSIGHWTRDDQVSSNVAASPGHHLQPVPSTSNPIHPIGGSVSTNTVHVSKRVEVHLHLTKTDIHNPAAIALGGQVVVNPPRKKMKPSDVLRVPSEMQKLRCLTERTFEKWTEDMVMTRGTQTVLDKISQGRTWITITGSPGEGKTTAGYLILKHLHSMGRQVYDIKTPEDYFKVKEAKQPLLMLNDIFGSLHFSRDKLGRWEDVFSDVLAMKEHQRDDEMDVRDRKKVQLTVILIGRSSVLKAASHHLGRFRDLVLKEECVVDLTHGLEIAAEERMKIWKCNSKGYNIDISDKIIKEVCQMSLPHGFPHCCRLFAAMYSKNKSLNMKSFFSKPLKFLNQTMESLMMDTVTGPLLREMLKHDGSLHLDSVTDDERRFQYSSAVEMLEGTYLAQNIDKITFHHPSVYDSAAFVVCKKDPPFVIKHCSLKFINERVVFSGLESGVHKETDHIVEINNRYIPVFLERLKLEYEYRNLSLISSHPSFHDENFVSQFMQCILPSSEVQSLSDSVRHLIHTRDRISESSFLFLMTKSRSDKILTYICQIVDLSHDDLTETLFGICEHSSVSSLEFFLRNFRKFDLNVKNVHYETPLMVATTKRSENIMKLLLERNVDVNTRSKGGNSALHNICKHGVEGDGDVVKMLIEKGADVNMQSSEYPNIPLHIACHGGHKNVVIALLDCGANVDQGVKFGNTPLIWACETSHVNVVTVLLDRGADINKTSSYGDTPLHKACVWGYVDVVTVLLDRGADINKTSSYGDTPLHKACVWGYVDVVTVLLDRGADINKTRSYGDTPLHKACVWGYVDVVTVLLDRGADINKTSSYGFTPLHKACYNGHVDVVTVLLDGGADINKTSSSGFTPLHKACADGHVDVLTVLLDRGADINKTDSYGDTPLNTTCVWGHVDLLTVLLDRGADINKTNSGGDTPLHRACFSGHVDVVTVLLDRGADINKTNSGGDTPLHRACFSGHVDVVTVLLDRGADINKTNSGGDTPLHRACFSGHVDVVTVLLDRGAEADINNTNSIGDTPLHRACVRGHVDVVTVLLDRGADINKTNSGGDTPLHRACFSGHVDVVTVLLDRGADINKTNSGGDTPLHRACVRGHVDVVTVLLDRGADINKTDSYGDTPLHTACSSGHVDVLTVLLDRGADINKTNNNGDTPLNIAINRRHVYVMNVLLHRMEGII